MIYLLNHWKYDEIYFFHRPAAQTFVWRKLVAGDKKLLNTKHQSSEHFRKISGQFNHQFPSFQWWSFMNFTYACSIYYTYIWGVAKLGVPPNHPWKWYFPSYPHVWNPPYVPWSSYMVWVPIEGDGHPTIADSHCGTTITSCGFTKPYMCHGQNMSSTYGGFLRIGVPPIHPLKNGISQ